VRCARRSAGKVESATVTRPAAFQLSAMLMIAAFGLTACAVRTDAGGCSGGGTSPISRAQVVNSLKGAGFAVAATTEGLDCAQADPGAAFAIGNAPHDPAAYKRYNRVRDQQGIVHCTLYRTPVYGDQLQSDLRERANSPVFHGRKARFWFKNIECLLYAGDANQQQQVARLSRAMHKLRRS
jgi:hypothetical protein